MSAPTEQQAPAPVLTPEEAEHKRRNEEAIASLRAQHATALPKAERK
jgi:hypothetical protein